MTNNKPTLADALEELARRLADLVETINKSYGKGVSK